MALLTSGEYGLSSKLVDSEKKSMLFVKLTDSAQRALNDYLSNLKICEVPFIEFNKDEGRILIPRCPKGNNTDSDKYMTQFKFDVTSNMAMQGMQGRFECVQHKRGSRQLLKFGQLTQRLRIHANEDVYETTKNRMAAIESEQRKNCTRQLDWTSTTTMNRKGKLDKFNKHLTISTTSTKCDDKDGRASSSSNSVPLPEVSNMIRNKSRPVNNAPPQRPNSNASKIRRSLKERIIHMLAAKPYKITELYKVLSQEGIRDCDRSSLTDVLKSVTTVRDNFYHLAKHSWNDVQEDWLFYSEHEKQIVKDNKMKNLTSPSGNSDSDISTSSNQSPNPISVEDHSPPNSYKRPGYINGADGFLTKRQRISHFSRQEPISCNVPNRLPTLGAEDSTRRMVPESSPLGETTANRKLTTIDSMSAYSDTYSSKNIPTVVISSSEISSTSNEVEEHHRRNTGHSSTTQPLGEHNGQFVIPEERNLPVMKAEEPQYLKYYVTIIDDEQRRKYKSDFSVIFKEYEQVHKEVNDVTNLFASLGESLRMHKKGSPRYNKIEADIFKKYHALKINPKFQAAKRRFEYLHEKLSHIKKLVNVYDEKTMKNTSGR